MKISRKLCVTAVALSAIAFAGPADAAASISIASANRSGDTLTVSGTAEFVDQPFVTLGSDAAGDAPPGFDQAGADLTGVAAAATVSGDLRMRWTMNSMPGGLGGSPGVVYGWTFCVGGTANCFELDIQRLTYVPTDGSLPTAARAVLSRCADATCNAGSLNTVQSGGMWVQFETGMKSATATLPSVLNATGGSVISAAGANRTAFATVGAADPAAMVRDQGDSLATAATYTVPVREVSLAVAGPGLDPTQAPYDRTVNPSEIGAWSAALNVAGMSGPRTLYARACFGQNNCAYTTRTLTL